MPDDLSQEQRLKKRSSKACDNCRLIKSKCERDSIDQVCDRCTEEGLACTSETPTRRRGPPKGYLNLVETRIHGLEAIIGVLLSSPNPAMRSTFNALSEDPFASTVLLQVANGPFGPRALAKFNTQRLANGPSNSSDRQPPPQHVAINEWQLQAIQTMIANSSSGNLPPPPNLLDSHTPFDLALGVQVPGEIQGTSQPSTSQETIQPRRSGPAGDFPMEWGWGTDVPFPRQSTPGDYSGQNNQPSNEAPWF